MERRIQSLEAELSRSKARLREQVAGTRPHRRRVVEKGACCDPAQAPASAGQLSAGEGRAFEAEPLDLPLPPPSDLPILVSHLRRRGIEHRCLRRGQVGATQDPAAMVVADGSHHAFSAVPNLYALPTASSSTPIDASMPAGLRQRRSCRARPRSSGSRSISRSSINSTGVTSYRSRTDRLYQPAPRADISTASTGPNSGDRPFRRLEGTGRGVYSTIAEGLRSQVLVSAATRIGDTLTLARRPRPSLRLVLPICQALTGSMP